MFKKNSQVPGNGAKFCLQFESHKEFHHCLNYVQVIEKPNLLE